MVCCWIVSGSVALLRFSEKREPTTFPPRLSGWFDFVAAACQTVFAPAFFPHVLSNQQLHTRSRPGAVEQKDLAARAPHRWGPPGPQRASNMGDCLLHPASASVPKPLFTSAAAFLYETSFAGVIRPEIENVSVSNKGLPAPGCARCITPSNVATAIGPEVS